MLKRLFAVITLSLFLSSCSFGQKKANTTNTDTEKRQLINALSYQDRPFVALFPHSTSKLLTVYIDNLKGNYNLATFDIEYLSGTSLKGGRTTLNLPATFPHTQAFLLGSCSSGGKCSFDTDLKNGTLKTKLDAPNEPIQVLKSDFVFVKGEVSSTDARVVYSPTNKKLTGQILADTQGLPIAYDSELAFYPVAISQSNATKVQGELTVKVGEVKSVLIFDGTAFKPLKAQITDSEVKISLSQDPWSKTVEIVRDDLKGSTESQVLYMVGPIILVK